MIALDTSVLARYILNDTPSEREIADQLIAGSSCAVSWSVLVELCWVLEFSVRLPRSKVVIALRIIADTDQITNPNDDLLIWAIDRYARGADFADMVHLASALSGADEFVCFDRKLARQAGSQTPIAVRILRA